MQCAVQWYNKLRPPPDGLKKHWPRLKPPKNGHYPHKCAKPPTPGLTTTAPHQMRHALARMRLLEAALLLPNDSESGIVAQ